MVKMQQQIEDKKRQRHTDPVLYTYVSKINKKYVDKMALKNNRSRSNFINELISAHRLDRPMKFTPKLSATEAKFNLLQAKKKKQLKKLS